MRLALDRNINSKLVPAVLAGTMSIFFAVTILAYGLKAFVILGALVFSVVFFIKMEYAFYFLLASRSIVDIFYSAEAPGGIRVTYLIGILIITLFIFCFVISGYDVFRSGVNRVYAAFLGLCILPIFLSENKLYAFADWLKLFQGFLVFNMAILLVIRAPQDKRKKRINAICWSIVASLAIPYAIFIKNLVLGTHIVMGGYTRYATFGSYSNLFSYYLLTAFPVCLFFYSVSEAKNKKRIWLLLIGFLLLTIYKTYTRNVWISVAILLFVWNLIRRNFKVVFICVAVIMAAVAFNPVVQDRLKDLSIIGAGKGFYDLDPTLLSHRIGIWQANLKYFVNESTWTQKFFGNGFDVKSKIVVSTVSGPIAEHSNYLTLLMTTGICGLILYLMYVAALARQSIMLFCRTKDIWFRNLACVFTSFLSAYIVVSVATHMVGKINFQYYFAALAGVVVAANMLESNAAVRRVEQ